MKTSKVIKSGKTSTLVQALQGAVVEKDVENAYRSFLSQQLPACTWASPYSTDGVVSWQNEKTTHTMLCEFKLDIDMKNRIQFCTVLGQTILYLKRWEKAGEALPSIVLIADRNEMTYLRTDTIKNFLNLTIDWSVAPSKGSPELLRHLVSTVAVAPYVVDVGNSVDDAAVMQHLYDAVSDSQEPVRASKANLDVIYRTWTQRVAKDNKKQQLSASEVVDVFLKALFAPEDVYLHPVKKGILCVPGYVNGVVVDTAQYQSFFGRFSQGYTPTEIQEFLSMKDRLMEDDARRRQGAFYTPSLWVAEAHREVERALGPDWRKECIVWDPAAGSGNLTRDQNDWGEKGGCLISSTLEAIDVEDMRTHGHGGLSDNVFKFDFLNETEIPCKIEKILREGAAAGKRLVFFMNPPYAEDGEAGAAGEAKAGVAAETVVAEACRRAGLGRTSRQLYAQFMFQAAELAKKYGFRDHTVALFSVPTFMSSGSYKPFRDWWYGQHAYWGGFLFQASHFADVSGRWGVSFTVWNSGNRTDAKKFLPIRLTDVIDFSVATTAIKEVYNSDDREASEWVEGTQKGHVGDTPKFSSGLKVAEKWTGGSLPGSLGVLISIGNNVMKSGTDVYILSGKPTHKGARHFDLLPSNWRRAVALYGARKLVDENWINQKDEYLAPDELAPGYDQWVNDCHVYALLHTSNNCTAMRNVQYKGNTWRIKNHWFWLKHEVAKNKLNTLTTKALYRDAMQEPGPERDPYFAQVLANPEFELSPQARYVLDMTTALWLQSLEVREIYYGGRAVTDDEPDLHLTAWDAGIYQLKNLWSEMYPEEWKQLKKEHKLLSEELRPGVYTYGFLK